jgi:dipeptidyl aminopeptidase/acylaminoacyl peptidase
LYRHPKHKRLLGLRYHQKLPKVVWLDPQYEALQVGLNKLLPSLVVTIAGSNKEETQFFITTTSDRHPTQYYHFDLNKRELSPVASTAPWIDPQRMRPMQGLVYKTRDGVELEGYVTLPENATKEAPAPLVVLPHGGPWARDTWSWDPEVQFLASRGYAVFQPNYRGSTSYGCRIPEDDNWAFRKMHDDVTDGVKTLLRTGLIDQNRMAIMGTSFGGYLALCGAVYEADFYKCAVTVAGVFDWERVMKEARSSSNFPASYGLLRRRLGDPKADAERFDSISPSRHVEQIKIPIYVAHGTEDPVANVAQSRRLISELKKHRVPYEAQFEGNEAHGFRHFENRIQLYSGIEKFLAKHLAPKPPQTAPSAQ